MNKKFYNRDAEIVARDLLGNVLVREINGNKLRARIVETEAYYGDDDPASRACQNGDLRKTMLMRSGVILVYGIHNNWMLNFVTGRKGKARAVLIRAVEPLNFSEKCNGPGLLTRALKIGKEFHKHDITNHKEMIVVGSKRKNFDIGKSFRIGVKKDLPKKLRFYIKGNKHISRK